MHASSPRMFAASLIVALVVQVLPAQTQKRPEPERPKPACEARRALSLVREQLSEARALENGAQRAIVMTRAAELLWAREEAEARAVLADAFEVASAHFKEHGAESVERKPTRPGSTLKGLVYALPDPRVEVIYAVGRRDPAWARKLAARAAEETRQRAADAEAKSAQASEAADKLLSMARGFLESDLSLSLAVAREMLRHAPSRFLPAYFYDLAKFDRAAADAFYAEALRAYSGADASALLLLSAYPFGFNMNVGLPSGYNHAGNPPQGFAPSPELQRQFAAAFLRLAERRLSEAGGLPPPSSQPYPLSEVELIYSTLAALEAVYGPADRNYAAAAAPLRQAAGALLPAFNVRRAESASSRSFKREPPREGADAGLLDRVLENAEQVKDPDRRDQQLVIGLQGVIPSESVERLEAAAGKIQDEFARRQFLDMVYFAKVRREVTDGRLDDAARLAEKIDSFEQRASLAAEFAAAELKLTADSSDPSEAPRAATLAESAYKSVQRAPESEEKVRALLSLAHVYSLTDPLRAPALLSEAVAVINRLPGFDITRTFAVRAVEGKSFSFYGPYSITVKTLPGELWGLAARDFETALTLSASLADRYQRSLAFVSLASKCLEPAPKPEKPAPKPTPAAKKAEAVPKPRAAPKKLP